MIGSHNSYTFLEPRISIFKYVSFLWRTQNKSIKEQKDSGVKYFDIRVRRYKNRWQLCHGLVDLKCYFKSLEEIVNSFSTYKVRLILEKGDSTIFKKEFNLIKEHPSLSFVAIKKNWEVLLNRDVDIYDYTYIPWYSSLSFIDNIMRFNFFNTIKRYAKKHNPVIEKDMIDNNKVLYFMDYI